MTDGIRGIIPAMVLQALLGNHKAQNAFHIIAGTSTGGIIACGLAKPNPISLADIINLYALHGSEIFDKNSINDGHLLEYPRYNATALENYLASQFASTYLSQVKDVELLVPSYAIELPKINAAGSRCAPLFFRSWQARGVLVGGSIGNEHDFKLASIARATSAAPTYFPPAIIVNRAGQSFTMIDGGVFANNPTVCAIIEAYHLYQSKNFLVVSLGTGSVPIRIDASAASWWGDVNWAGPLISIFMDGNSQTVAFETAELFGDDQFTRLDISLASPTPEGETVNPDLDDASPDNIKALVNKAKELIHAEDRRIKDLANLLAEPKANVQPIGSLPAKGMLQRTGAGT
jgi:uncharacterized protein